MNIGEINLLTKPCVLSLFAQTILSLGTIHQFPLTSQQEGSGFKSWGLGCGGNSRTRNFERRWNSILSCDWDICVITWQHVLMVLVIKIELYSMFPCLICDKLVGVVVCQCLEMDRHPRYMHGQLVSCVDCTNLWLYDFFSLSRVYPASHLK